MLRTPGAMIRTTTRRRAIRFIIIAVVSVMMVPVAGASAHVFLLGMPSGITSEAPLPLGVLHPDGTAEDEAESHDAGSTGYCMIDLGESFVPEVVPPAAGALVTTASFHFHCAPYLPRIFRPPIG
jgi:hypothetical protein